VPNYDDLLRKVRLAVAAAEFVLEREIRSVLDVGCGEGRWRGVLRRMRPGLEYLGVDSSDYVVRRFGKRRNIRKGSVGTVGQLGIRRKFDLVVCADVLWYVPTPELRRGLADMRKLMRGVAYIEAYATGDAVEGDLVDWIDRSETSYRRAFSAAGLVPCGLNCWVPREELYRLSIMERCGC
jgi:SAM-dependent methyltransferase